MTVKVVAIGNVLMKDDAVGIEVAREIEEKLLQNGIEVIYGETDFQYSLSKVKEADYVFILDGSYYGKGCGRITSFSLEDIPFNKRYYSHHSYSFLDLLKLYYPQLQGQVYAIEIKEVELGVGLSMELQEKLKDICEEILLKIERAIEVIK